MSTIRSRPADLSAGNYLAMGMILAQRGHVTHGRELNYGGQLYNYISYSDVREPELIDYAEMATLAR